MMDKNQIKKLTQYMDNDDLQKFIKNYDKNIIYVDEDDNTILHYVVQKNCFKILDYLLHNNNLNFQVKNKLGYTIYDVANDENKKILFDFVLKNKYYKFNIDKFHEKIAKRNEAIKKLYLRKDTIKKNIAKFRNEITKQKKIIEKLRLKISNLNSKNTDIIDLT